MDLNDEIAYQWNQITWSMRSRGIFQSEAEDKLIWKGYGGRSTVYVKDIYLQLQYMSPIHQANIFPTPFWKTGCPLKTIIFAWLVFQNKTLTWDNLQKRNWNGPAICPLCKLNEETNLHIFLICPQSQGIWQNLAVHFGFNRISFPSIMEAFDWWGKMEFDWRPIPLLTLWAIWKWRNGALFHSRKENYVSIYESIISQYNACLISNNLLRYGGKMEISLEPSGDPRAYFDGATQNCYCACGVYIILMEGHHIDIFWHGGKGTNNKAEVMALAGLLIFCDYLNIHDMQIFGDSKVIIDHVRFIHSIKIHNLLGWLSRIDSI